MPDGKDENAARRIVDGIDNPVISRPQAVVVGILQFLTPGRPRVGFQKENFSLDAGSHLRGKIGNFFLGLEVDKDAIAHLAERSAKKSRKGRKGPVLRDRATAISIRSSRSSLVRSIS